MNSPTNLLSPAEVVTLEQHFRAEGYPNIADTVVELAKMPGQKLAEPHNCLDHLVHREHNWTERHGLDSGPYEHCYQEWYHCTECGADYDPEEVAEMSNEFTCAQCQRDIVGQYPAKGHDDLCRSCASTWVPASQYAAPGSIDLREGFIR